MILTINSVHYSKHQRPANLNNTTQFSNIYCMRFVHERYKLNPLVTKLLQLSYKMNKQHSCYTRYYIP